MLVAVDLIMKDIKHCGSSNGVSTTTGSFNTTDYIINAVFCRVEDTDVFFIFLERQGTSHLTKSS